jgi:cytochrome P450
MIHGLAGQTDNIVDIRSRILQGMMASQETTAVLIANTILLLSRHLETCEELRK